MKVRTNRWWNGERASAWRSFVISHKAFYSKGHLSSTCSPLSTLYINMTYAFSAPPMTFSSTSPPGWLAVLLSNCFADIKSGMPADFLKLNCDESQTWYLLVPHKKLQKKKTLTTSVSASTTPGRFLLGDTNFSLVQSNPQKCFFCLFSR